MAVFRTMFLCVHCADGGGIGLVAVASQPAVWAGKHAADLAASAAFADTGVDGRPAVVQARADSDEHLGRWRLDAGLPGRAAGRPQELYEAAEIDGAGAMQRARHVTIPFMSPHLFFTLVMGLIGAAQYFTQAS